MVLRGIVYQMRRFIMLDDGGLDINAEIFWMLVSGPYDDCKFVAFRQDVY